MTELVLFHHVQGLTPGLLALADELRAAGHVVHAPDLFDGRTFDSIEQGVAHVRGIGSAEEVAARGARAVEDLPGELVYLGFSLGVVPAQQLAQTRPGARGAVFVDSCLPVAEFGSWPPGVPVQVHGMDADALFLDDGDLAAARELVATTPGAELFTYPGDGHLWADRSLPAYEPAAAALFEQRLLGFLRTS